jgi:eukaryotic-like serine/threonine-protein kinase
MNEPPNAEVAIFAAALELPADQRSAYLDQACAGDVALRRQVEALLRVHDDAGNFFDKLASVEQPTSAEGTTTGSNRTIRIAGLASVKAGDRIGRYKLLQQIGEGGCGVVYMAEQEEPVRRRVALKIIKLGMDTRSVIARFEAERQALALMDHPNIAKVLDAGATETGRPYFVMELVRGIKITDYCDENNLSTAARLELFVQVCQAIQHAHQKGIIHRDIKPSNILVADHDGKPVPKIIDFGIAKATTDQRLTDKTLFTAFEQFIGTPAYMSPEQAKLSGLDIDTRSDIYSLGVLLYELLTAKTPFEAKRLLEAGLDEIRRIIQEEEPVRPSTRLQTLGAAEQTTVARHRQCEPPKLFGIIHGDLDWIVMKCLEKDRSRRYETVNGLAADVERHLADEPVVARPPSTLYQLHKVVRRNKLIFLATSVVIAALIIGLGISTWMFFREQQVRRQAETERKIAETEAAKATAISDFLQEMLQSANPEDARGSDYQVRQLLDDFSASLGQQLAGQPEVEATVRATIGNAYRRLGLTDKAEPELERALVLRRRLYGEQSEMAAQSLVDHAWNLYEDAFTDGAESNKQTRLAEAETETQGALDIYRLRDADAKPVIHALWTLEVIARSQERPQEVEMAGDAALALARNSPGRDFPEIANVMHELADLKISQKKYVEAEQLARAAVEMHRRLQGPEHPETAWSLLVLGSALESQHKLPEAEESYREALAIFRKYYSFQHKSVRMAIVDLAGVLEAEGNSTAIEPLYREVLAGQWKSLTNDNLAMAETFVNFGDTLQAQGKQAVAEQGYRDALDVYTKLGMGGSPEYSATAASLRDVLEAENKPDAILSLDEEILVAQRSALGNDNPAVAATLFGMANFLKSQNRPAEAAQKYRESLDIMLKLHGQENPSAPPAWVIPALLEAGEKQQAANVCRVMLDSSSTNAIWFNNASWCLATTENPTNRDPALAVELAERAVQINPQGDWNTVGVAYYRAGDFKKALADLRKSEQRASGEDNSYDTFFLAMTEHQVGNADVARRYYAHAVQWMNEHGPQNQELLRFQAESKQLLDSEIRYEIQSPDLSGEK